jgi:hypothetical protein
MMSSVARAATAVLWTLLVSTSSTRCNAERCAGLLGDDDVRTWLEAVANASAALPTPHARWLQPEPLHDVSDAVDAQCAPL